ncbi:hypothetical protein EJP02_513 [Escherichia phage EJP2]|nr:hypothetical protein EJP02_513 [Escherichia phage EJP2]
MQVLSTNTFKIVFFLYRGTIIQYCNHPGELSFSTESIH